MDHPDIDSLLRDVAEGRLTVADAARLLRATPEVAIGYATVDTHRRLRQGHNEVVYGETKTAEQIVGIVEVLSTHERPILVTRVSPETAADVARSIPMQYHAEARALTRFGEKVDYLDAGFVAIVTAGTSDLPIAEEARVTADILGLRTESFYDIGVAGIHRLLSRAPRIASASAVIVIAGMEGALPSVLGGLVEKPVIAVPASVGYGTGLGGFTALFSMLASCASGVTVVNIDNGFGAAYAAYRILRSHATSR